MKTLVRTLGLMTVTTVLAAGMVLAADATKMGGDAKGGKMAGKMSGKMTKKGHKKGGKGHKGHKGSKMGKMGGKMGGKAKMDGKSPAAPK